MTDDPETKKFLREMADFKAKDRGGIIHTPPGVTMRGMELPGPRDSPDELIAKGWVYRNISWESAADWDARLQRVGDGHYKILTVTNRLGRKFGTSDRRGQIMVSAEGKIRMRIGRH